MTTAANFIAGEWLSATDGAENINPSDTRDIVSVIAFDYPEWHRCRATTGARSARAQVKSK